MYITLPDIKLYFLRDKQFPYALLQYKNCSRRFFNFCYLYYILSYNIVLLLTDINLYHIRVGTRLCKHSEITKSDHQSRQERLLQHKQRAR